MTKYCPICRERYPNIRDVCPADGMRLFDLEDPLVGKLIDGRYQVTEKLGSGGMGAVYLVREESTGENLAMKVLSPLLAADPLQRARFFRESKVVKSIEHDNVIATGPLPLLRTVGIGIQIASGLSRAHGLGVIHRDVKCENVMFASLADELDWIKLVDFGLAWMKGGARLTATGQVFGTPEYLSPEQARGDPATPLSDLYSLGVVLYETASGHVPFEGPATHVMRAHMERQPPPPSSMSKWAGLPERFDRLVLKLLRKEPERRYRDAHHLLDDLTDFARELTPTGTEEPRSPSRPPSPIRTSSDALSVVSTTARRWQRIETLARDLQTPEQPPWLHPSLTKLRALVEEVRHLGDTLDAASLERSAKEADIRLGRERLGRAVDVISRDESILQRELDINRRQLETVEDGLRARRMHRDDPPEDLTARRNDLCSEISKKAHHLEDVGFQLAQLRGKLAAMGAEFECDDSERRSEVSIPSRRFSEILDELEQVASRVEQFFLEQNGAGR